jgi:hypothetical protein
MDFILYRYIFLDILMKLYFIFFPNKNVIVFAKNNN